MSQADSPNTTPTPAPSVIPRTRRRARKEEEPHPYDFLPFVGTRDDGQRDFWVVTPTGDYQTDCLIGDAYARALLPHLLRQEFAGPLLSFIVQDIARKGQYERDRGIIAGMFTPLGRVFERFRPVAVPPSTPRG